MKRLHLSLVLLLFLTGCGYRTGSNGILSSYSTISVPYAIGDRNGDLTSAIIHELGTSACFRYKRDCAELILYVNVLRSVNENIGFRYERDKNNELTKGVIPAETRLNVLTEIQVVEAESGCTLVGPVQFWTYVDFDHDYYSSEDSVNVFSLGQFSDYDDAQDMVQRPLNRRVAQKIVDYLKYCW